MPGDGFIGWVGGVDFLCNLLSALNYDLVDIRYDVYLLLSSNSTVARINRGLRSLIRSLFLMKFDLSGFNKIEYRNLDVVVRGRFSQISIIFFDGTNYSYRKVLKKYNPDVIFPCTRVHNAQFKIPWIGYFADIQHKKFPEFFSKKEIKRRDIFFQKMVSNAKHIIVNSKSAKNDINRYYKNLDCQIYALPFSPIPHPDWFSSNLNGIEKYNLPKNFFLVSNQFWRHKNHITAFKALKILNEECLENNFSIVCTGDIYDDRDPEYYINLRKEIISLGLSKEIVFLGYIPKSDQIEVMKNSICLIQPTLFEGGPGGGAVYDALSVGVRVIVSNIEVNLEIEAEDVIFFEASDSSDLAQKMQLVARNLNHKVEVEIQQERGKKRLQVLSRFLANIIEDATNS